ncbi:MAG: NDP-sugar synthase [bacterium]|nr:NDP-sugar synthase [bacterium]
MKELEKVLILAGGFATRLWPLTEKRAKPLLPLAGKPLIGHIIEKIPPHLEILISTNTCFEDGFLALKRQYPDRKIELFIEDSHSDSVKTGALRAIGLVIEQFAITSPLLVIAGDNYFDFRLEDFLKNYQGNTLLAAYDSKSLNQAKQFGVVEVEGDRLSTFAEKPENPASTLISTGCYLFCPEHLSLIVEYSRNSSDNLGKMFEHLLKKGELVDVFQFNSIWMDIGSFESYLDAHRLLCGQNQISASSSLVNCQLGKAVSVAEGCRIEDSTLDEVIILENCTIKDARLRRSIIDQDCVIEGIDLDHKMIREGSSISGKSA